MERILFWALISIVALAPLPLGSNRPLGWSVLSGAVGVLLIFWAGQTLLAKTTPSIRVANLKLPAVLFGATLLWVVVQLVPGIPFALAHPAWQDMNVFLSSDVAGRITLDPESTVTVFMRWIMYAAVFWLTVQLCTTRAAAYQAIDAFILASTVYALYGLVAQLSGSNTILVFQKWASTEAVTSTFVNRNSYATFAGFGLIAVTGRIVSRSANRRIGNVTLRQRVVLSLAGSSVREIFLYLAFFLLASALVLSGSRGGVVSTFAGMVVFLLCFARGRSQRLRLIGRQLAALTVAGLFVLSISGAVLGERFGIGLDGSRKSVYLQTAIGIGDHAVLGAGLGSFPQVFPLYRGDDEHWDKYWDRAHNSYLENALELGVPSSVFLYLSLSSLAFICWRGVHRRARDQHFAAIGLGAFTLAALHSLSDFSLQIPAVTVSFMFLMGVAVAQSFSSRPR